MTEEEAVGVRARLDVPCVGEEPLDEHFRPPEAHLRLFAALCECTGAGTDGPPLQVGLCVLCSFC
eukprot:gene2379-3673_t